MNFSVPDVQHLGGYVHSELLMWSLDNQLEQQDDQHAYTRDTIVLKGGRRRSVHAASASPSFVAEVQSTFTSVEKAISSASGTRHEAVLQYSDAFSLAVPLPSVAGADHAALLACWPYCSTELCMFPSFSGWPSKINPEDTAASASASAAPFSHALEDVVEWEGDDAADQQQQCVDDDVADQQQQVIVIDAAAEQQLQQQQVIVAAVDQQQEAHVIDAAADQQQQQQQQMVEDVADQHEVHVIDAAAEQQQQQVVEATVDQQQQQQQQQQVIVMEAAAAQTADHAVHACANTCGRAPCMPARIVATQRRMQPRQNSCTRSASSLQVAVQILLALQSAAMVRGAEVECATAAMSPRSSHVDHGADSCDEGSINAEADSDSAANGDLPSSSEDDSNDDDDDGVDMHSMHSMGPASEQEVAAFELLHHTNTRMGLELQDSTTPPTPTDQVTGSEALHNLGKDGIPTLSAPSTQQPHAPAPAPPNTSSLSFTMPPSTGMDAQGIFFCGTMLGTPVPPPPPTTLAPGSRAGMSSRILFCGTLLNAPVSPPPSYTLLLGCGTCAYTTVVPTSCPASATQGMSTTSAHGMPPTQTASATEHSTAAAPSWEAYTAEHTAEGAPAVDSTTHELPSVTCWEDGKSYIVSWA